MSLSSRFLSLSMKQQICISIVVLTLFCLLVILIVCCSLLYEILHKDYEQKKLYFYNKYKKYVESAFYYQSFHVMQYEEILHRIQKQIWKLQKSIVVYQTIVPLQNYSDIIINMTNRKEYNFTELDLKESKDMPFFYVISLLKHERVQSFVQNFSLNHYQPLVNSIFSNNIYDSFTIPGYGVPIMDKPILYNFNFSTIFGFNHTKINEALDDCNDSIDILRTKLFYIINEFVTNAEKYLKYVGNKLTTFEIMFPKFYQEIIIHSTDIFYDEEKRSNFSKIFVSYLSNIQFGEDKFSLVSSNESYNYYYTEMNTIPNALFFLNNNFSDEFDIDFVPFYYSNMTLHSKDLCALFKIKQLFLSGKEFDFEEIYSEINNRKDKFEICFIDNNLIKSQEEINDIFNIYFENFTEYTNLIYQGIFEPIPEHPEFSFYFIKYSYPNFNTLREFQSEYLFSNQVNFLAFIPFKRIQKYVDHIYQVNLNIFFMTILIIIYCWILCLIGNLIIFYRVIDDWTMPITKLQEAVESNLIKDENIFIYKYDDIINELFITCKELLNGQINHNNNDNDIYNFNILSNDNEKKIDKNIYKKNFIINNEIMEELIEKQQSLMDFSNNVKLNELNSIDTYLPSQKNNNLNINNEAEEKISAHLGSNKKTEKEKDNEKEKEKEKEIKSNKKTQKNKENESYIKLFKISEYFDYFRSKLDSNNIIFLNENTGDSKTNQLLSKNNSKSNTNSITNKKNKNDEANENSNYINMMDETNITYLWYMEAKKKNKSFNYYMNNDCRELFSEYYDNYKEHSNNEKKSKTFLYQKE